MSIFNVEYNNIKSLYKIRTRFDLLWVILNHSRPWCACNRRVNNCYILFFLFDEKIIWSLLLFHLIVKINIIYSTGWLLYVYAQVASIRFTL